MSAERNTVWIPAVPLPLFVGWRMRTEQCVCGRKFKGKTRRHDYEIHYRREHESILTASEAQMEVTREEAERIYAEVWA